MNSYNDLPDAPYIREAETKGRKDTDFVCPVCGMLLPNRLYMRSDTKEIIGCDWCISSVDIEDWMAEQNE